MENGTNSIPLNQVSFPVYRLGKDKPITIDNVVMYYLQYKENNKTVYKIVDDRNIDKPTLALRRLELSKKEVKLKRLGKATFFLADFIKLATRSTWFIDSKGQIFQYKKSESVPLVFKKIKKIIAMPTGGALIEVDGVASRFKTLYMPPIENKYVGLLKYGMGYILYGTYPQELTKTRRNI